MISSSATSDGVFFEQAKSWSSFPRINDLDICSSDSFDIPVCDSCDSAKTLQNIECDSFLCEKFSSWSRDFGQQRTARKMLTVLYFRVDRAVWKRSLQNGYTSHHSWFACVNTSGCMRSRIDGSQRCYISPWSILVPSNF